MENPMILPIKDTDVPNGLISILSSVLENFLMEMSNYYDDHEGVALYES